MSNTTETVPAARRELARRHARNEKVYQHTALAAVADTGCPVPASIRKVDHPEQQGRWIMYLARELREAAARASEHGPYGDVAPLLDWAREIEGSAPRGAARAAASALWSPQVSVILASVPPLGADQ